MFLVWRCLVVLALNEARAGSPDVDRPRQGCYETWMCRIYKCTYIHIHSLIIGPQWRMFCYLSYIIKCRCQECKLVTWRLLIVIILYLWFYFDLLFENYYLFLFLEHVFFFKYKVIFFFFHCLIIFSRMKYIMYENLIDFFV